MMLAWLDQSILIQKQWCRNNTTEMLRQRNLKPENDSESNQAYGTAGVMIGDNIEN